MTTNVRMEKYIVFIKWNMCNNKNDDSTKTTLNKDRREKN